MAAEPASAIFRRRPRAWVTLVVLVVVLAAALAAFAMRRSGSGPTPEDCGSKPPPDAFAIAGCDDGAAPANAHPATPAAPPPPAAR
jgi:hypothetical protein